MIEMSPYKLSSYMKDLLSTGRVTFLQKEAEVALGLNHGAFLDTAERQQRKGNLISPRRGFYVIVPPQYWAWGAPPPSWYIDDMMFNEGSPYYVGMLKAAELHGASHQAVMAFQVVTGKRMPNIQAGRSVIDFHFRKDLTLLTPGIGSRKTDTGNMNISCIELTSLDLLRYPHSSAGLDNVATILSDLGARIDADKLACLARAFERSIVQRLGYLLKKLGYENKIHSLYATLTEKKQPSWVELEPSQASDPDFTVEPMELDTQWKVIVRRPPEVEE